MRKFKVVLNENIIDVINKLNIVADSIKEINSLVKNASFINEDSLSKILDLARTNYKVYTENIVKLANFLKNLEESDESNIYLYKNKKTNELYFSDSNGESIYNKSLEFLGKAMRYK